ncbi:MAG: L-lysine 2,3-aminomutase [Syntrophus sp. PtaB.Bin001]|nr:MAG: L-lysine 2,3-aminomutase [Syntrophus sp. PtaB.Bin001]
MDEADWQNWRWQYRNRIRTEKRLSELLGEMPEDVKLLRAVIRTYPFSITPYYFSLIRNQDFNDPVRLQCVPDSREISFSLGGVDDPLAESRDMPLPGLIHRYADRCLVMVTQRCAMYCRHCNRKRLWTKGAETSSSLQSMIDYVAASPGIREVIVSGGDPLTMPESVLDKFLGALHAIPHVEVLRIGSRMPVVLPMRITPSLVRMLRKHRPLWFNTQFNSPREITPESAAACERLVDAGIPVSNQSVLLRGVNDDYETMRELLYGLQRISVRPYYLFHCDPVRGADHFRVDLWKGMEMMERISRQTSGLCVPRYVLDVPGGKGKMPLQTFSLLNESFLV